MPTQPVQVVVEVEAAEQARRQPRVQAQKLEPLVISEQSAIQTKNARAWAVLAAAQKPRQRFQRAAD
jgi:hypothetical protein